MNENMFDNLQRLAQSTGADAVFELLARRFRDEKRYPHLFEARLMHKRRELGLPLIQVESLGELPDDKRRTYEDAYIAAAREVGGLFLAEGDIVRAWPYFRAIGETTSVTEAIEKVEPSEGLEPIIEIAYHERANPRKGFELILANYGTCSAITSFEQFPGREGREDCIRILVLRLHGDLVESLRNAIASREGQAAESRNIPSLISGREWLFADNNYHIDTSHLASVIRFSIDLHDRESLALAFELTKYGERLSPLFHYRGQPPFESIYTDYGTYLQALLGQDETAAIDHFRQKARTADPNEVGSGPAQVLVGLLSRLGRYLEAIDASLEFLGGVEPGHLACPSVVQLCQLAGDYERLKAVARKQDDLLSFAAALLAADSKPDGSPSG